MKKISGTNVVVRFNGFRVDRMDPSFTWTAPGHVTPPELQRFFEQEATSGWRTHPAFPRAEKP